MSVRSTAVLFAIVAAVACRGERETTHRAPAPAKSAKLDLATVMRRAHFAFRPNAEGFAARDARYSVQADGRSFSVRAFRRMASQPFTFTASLTRDGARLDEGSPALTLDEEGALRAKRGSVVERLRNNEEGVEASWELATAPAGHGDLVVELATDGPATQTSSGAHVLDPTTGLGLKVNDAVVVDALGRRTPLPLELEGGHVVYRVSDALLRSAQFPIVIDPVISPEYGMDSPVSSAAPGREANPAIACSTTNCLVAWEDFRRGALADVFAARVSSTGAVLDTFGLSVASTIGHDGAPTVAFNGTHYVLAWSYSPTSSLAPYESIGVARVEPSTGAIDARSTVALAHSGSPEVTCRTGECALVAIDAAASIRFTRLNAAAAQVDVPAKTIAVSALEIGGVSVAHYGGTWLTAYTDATAKVRTVRVDASGTVLDSTPRTPIGGTTLQRSPRLCAGGSNYLLVFTNDSGAGADLYGARLDVTGASLDGAGFGIRRTADNESSPAISYDGTNWYVGWTESVPRSAYSTVNAARVSAMGRLLDTTPISLSSTTTAYSPTLATLGGTTFASFVDAFGSDATIYVQRLDSAGKLVGTTSLVPRAANTQAAPAVSHGTTSSLVVWEDSRAGDIDLYAVRLDATGTPLDSTGIVVANRAMVDEARPAVDFDGTNWFVIWRDHRLSGLGVYGARVTTAGVVLDPAGASVGSGAVSYTTTPLLGFDGTNHLAVFHSATEELKGIRVSKSATPVDSSPATVMSSTLARSLGGVAFDGTNYLVVASDAFSGSTSGDIYGVRVGKDLAVVGSTFAISTGLYRQSDARVAFAAGRYFVAWHDGRNGIDADVYGARVGTDGVVLDPAGIAVATGVGDQTTPDVVADGVDYFVVWAHAQGSVADIHSAFVGANGAVRGPNPLVISADSDLELSPRATSVSATRRLVTYARFDTSPTFGSLRARARFVDGLPSGRACTTSGECVSGACVDGVCCENACTGQCAACNVPGKEGFCVAIAGVPRGGRSACTTTPSTCGARCDGVDQSKCTFPPNTTACSSDACIGGVETHASTCNGAGGCSDMPKTCGAFACGTTACRVTCTGATDCAAGFACKDGTCVPALGLGEACTTTAACSGGLFCTDGVCCGLATCATGESCAVGMGKCVKLNGTACTIGAECASGSCVDSVCCESACGGQCEACDVEGSKGKCVPVSGAPHGARSACDKGSELCAARTCDGVVDATKCVGYANSTTTTCKPARCDGEKLLAAGTCTGAGACGEQKEVSCVPYRCEASACRTTCSADDQCAAGFSCRAGACEPVGTKCSEDGTSVIGAGDVSSSCAPYVCRTGTCIGRCESATDCAAGNVCNAGGQCVPRPPEVGVEDGGGCAYGSRSSAAAWLAALIALSMVRRSRQARARQASRR